MTDPSVVSRDFFVSSLFARRIGGSKAQICEVLDAFLADLAGALRHEQAVQLKGFGRFTVVRTAERAGRNPRTGEPAVVPARKRVKFKPSKTLLEPTP